MENLIVLVNGDFKNDKDQSNLPPPPACCFGFVTAVCDKLNS